MITDLASTSASSATPTFSSSTYTFVAGDSGNWVFVGAGSGWHTGFYKITSITGNNCIVDAAIGHVILYNTTTGAVSLSTVVGCGGTASGTFSVDYAGPGQTADNFTDSTFTGAGTAVISNTASVFTPAMVGNAIHLTAGTGATVGWYTITAYTSGTAVAVNVSPGTGTIWTGYVGGAAADLGNINSATAGLGPVAGNIVWMSGTFSETTTALTTAFSGAAAAATQINGYKTYWGDGYLGRTNGNGPPIATNMAVLTFTSGRFLMASSSWINASSISCTGTTNTVNLLSSSINGAVFNCQVSTSTTSNTGVGITAGGVESIVKDCGVYMTGATGTTTGIVAATTGNRVVGNWVVTSSTNAAATGITISNSGLVFKNQLIGSGGIGIYCGGAAAADNVIGNTVTGYVDDCNLITATTVLQYLSDNLFTDCTGYPLNMTSTGNAAFLSNNRYRQNTSGGTNAIGNGGSWTVVTNYFPVVSGLSATDYNTPFTNLQLLPASPAVGTGSLQYSSIGALQPAASGQTTSAY
jgi:hypothetical protein